VRGYRELLTAALAVYLCIAALGALAASAAYRVPQAQGTDSRVVVRSGMAARGQPRYAVL
jgi:hypothetical protein